MGAGEWERTGRNRAQRMEEGYQRREEDRRKENTKRRRKRRRREERDHVARGETGGRRDHQGESRSQKKEEGRHRSRKKRLKREEEKHRRGASRAHSLQAAWFLFLEPGPMHLTIPLPNH